MTEGDEIVPRAAATVLVVRDARHRPDPSNPVDGIEVLMLRRNFASVWLAGSYLFPGGAVDEEDGAPELAARCLRWTDQEASRLLGVEHGGLAYYLAAVRECFEEAGILIACDRNGVPSGAPDPATARRLVSEREALNAGRLRFAEILEAEDLMIDTDRLFYLSHWITPSGAPRRYDTRFFVAELPSGQEAAHDDVEAIESLWIAPAEALARERAGKITMLPPTLSSLETICGFERVGDLLDSIPTSR